MVKRETTYIGCLCAWCFACSQVLLLDQILRLLSSLDQRLKLIFFGFSFIQFSLDARVSLRFHSSWLRSRYWRLRLNTLRKVGSCFNLWVLLFNILHFRLLGWSERLILWVVAQLNLRFFLAFFKPCIFQHSVIYLSLNLGHDNIFFSCLLTLRILGCTISDYLHDILC